MEAREFSAEAEAVQQMLARARLSIDDVQPGRTCFLSHIGAQKPLRPAAWMGHRELFAGLGRANLSTAQRASLARAVVVEYGREFGVGRLRLEAFPSGLPLGGAALRLQPRTGGSSCLYTWAVGVQAVPARCDWLLLRASPKWACEPAPRNLNPRGLELLAQLGGTVVLIVPSAVAAVQVARACRGVVPVAAHPRFSPYLEPADGEGAVLLWPHDALDGAALRRKDLVAIALVEVPEAVSSRIQRYLERRPEGREVEVVEMSCPGRADRAALEAYWRGCGEPAVLMTGDPGWATSGARWLRALGANVVVHGEATQLSLL